MQNQQYYVQPMYQPVNPVQQMYEPVSQVQQPNYIILQPIQVAPVTQPQAIVPQRPQKASGCCVALYCSGIILPFLFILHFLIYRKSKNIAEQRLARSSVLQFFLALMIYTSLIISAYYTW